MNVLVAGGGGFLGRRLIGELLERNHAVTSFAYSASEFAGVSHPNLRTFACDITRPEHVRGACEGIDVVISCVGITRLSGSLTHMDVDYQGNLNLLLEAERAKVKKYCFISPEGVDDGHDFVPLLEAKYLFEQELKKSGIKWLIFRAGGFFRDLKEMGKTAAKGSMIVFGNGENRFTPIDVGDLAQIMAEDMLVRENEVVTVGGPADMSWNEICRACFTYHGKPPKILHIPTWVGRLTLCLIKPLSRKYDAMGRLILFMCTTDLLTEKRGKMSLAQYLQENA
jgi:uncharacterized protein YbjT (DUF2867 family)